MLLSVESEPLAAGTPFPARVTFRALDEIARDAPVDYHLHTHWTDGTASAHTMALTAQARGIRAILFSEHIRHTSDFFPAFQAQARALEIKGVTIFVGVESKTLDHDGTLDLTLEVAKLCDALVASVHSPPAYVKGASSWSNYNAAEAVQLEFELAMGIVTRSRAHILAHPMGMSIARFGARPIHELRALARACAEYDKVFELNPRYCADVPAWLEIVTMAHCKISFGSDAHRADDVGKAWEVFAQTQRRA